MVRRIKVMVERVKTCNECKKKFSTYGYNLSEYAYKVNVSEKVHYFCSYNCYNKYLTRLEEKRKR